MNIRRRAAASTRGQRGAALLTAMIIVTLVATMAAAMVWQQWRAVQVETAERARVQSAWILSGALDFAKLILREDARSGKPTALTEPWATPLAESRLSTFLAVDKSNADDGPEAFLSGNIADAQGRYNLTDLIVANKVDPEQLKILQRLCETAGVDASVATLIANSLRDATASSSATEPIAAAPLMPRSVAQLSWLGLDASTVQALQPYVIVLPLATNLNVNTASAEVLAAVGNIDPGTAQQFVQTRQRAPLKDATTFMNLVPDAQKPVVKVDVRSSFFIVTGRLRLVDRVLVERSLLQRQANGQSTVLQRERIAGLDQG